MADKTFVCLFVLRLNVPVNNFSVMSGRDKTLKMTKVTRAIIIIIIIIIIVIAGRAKLSCKPVYGSSPCAC